MYLAVIDSLMIYKCFCKATNRETGKPRYSHNWLFSKRAFLKVFESRLECGRWIIPFENIRNMKLCWVSYGFFSAAILQVQTEDRTYQFGLNPWAKPWKHIPIEYSEEDIRLEYSWFSIALRLLILAYLGWFFFIR